MANKFRKLSLIMVYCPYKKFRTQINTCKSLRIYTKLKSLKVYGSFPQKQQFVSNICEKSE